MSKVIDMTDKTSATRPSKPQGDVIKDQASHNANFADRLYFVVDLTVYDLIVWLKDVLEAPSFGDVVRQAVRAYALILAETGNINDDIYALPVESDPSEKLKSLNIRIPNRTKERLVALKEITGAKYTDIVTCGLGMLAHTAKEQEDELAKLMGGTFNAVQLKDKSSGHCKSNNSCVYGNEIVDSKTIKRLKSAAN